MIGSTRAVRVWAYPAPCDLRKGFNGLSHLVTWQLAKDLLSGDQFLFCNRRRNAAKVLMYDGTGLAIYHKRLERQRFACLWRGEPGTPVQLTSTELALFLEGSQLVARQRLSPPEFRPAAAVSA
jgi:transposase